MTLKEKLQQRAKLIEDVRALKNKAKSENRDLTAEEKQQADKMLDDAEQLRQQVENDHRDEQRDKRLQQEEQWTDGTIGRRTEPGSPEGRTEKREFAFSRNGRELKLELRGPTATKEYEDAFRRYVVAGERRDTLQADSDVGGGYITAPQLFVANLIQAVDNQTFMRRISNVLPPIPQADGIGVPTLDTDLDDADWTAEIKAAKEDTKLAFGKRELRPHPVTKLVKISKTLIRRALIDPEVLVRDRLAYKFAVTQEKAFLTGSGSQQPLGIFTANANGISTSRDVSTGNTATAVTFDGLKNAKWSLKPQYQQNAQWACHRDFGKQVDLIKDSEGRYIWQPATTPGDPDRLLGFPINYSEYSPNTFTAEKYVAVLGDFSKYWIVDSLGMTIQTLMELYAVTNQNGYIGRLETDGAPVLEEAFARVKLAAAG